MIWGLPGINDGYGFELEALFHLDEYLALIGKTYAEYTDIPEVRPHAVSTSTNMYPFIIAKIYSETNLYITNSLKNREVYLMQLYYKVG